MSNMDLYNLALRFRVGIEKARDSGEKGELFAKFPRGCCGYCSDLFSQYLIDNGIGPVLYVNGTFYSDDENDPYHMQAHTWLEVDGNLVDMTGDQFRSSKSLENHTEVYVGPFTAWYANFEVGPCGRHPHYGLERVWSNYLELVQWYRVIRKYMGEELKG